MLTIKVKGVIDSSDNKAYMELWGFPGSVFCVDDLETLYESFPDEKQICLNIDCDGGSVEEGLKIYDSLRGSGREIFTNITGGCHSMSVVVLLAAPKENRSANKNIRALIHRVYTGFSGYVSAEDLLKMAEECITEEEAILDIYEDRTGTDRNKLGEVMREEKMHDAESLKDLGFISKINSYNTNQFFNSLPMTKVDKKQKSAFEAFMTKVNKIRGKVVNFDYRDKEGNVVFSTESETDDLAQGDEVTLTDGGSSGTFDLEDGREVVIADNIVESISRDEDETLEERVEALEELLEEATNMLRDQEETINSLEAENEKLKKNQKGSNHIPAVKEVSPDLKKNQKGSQEGSTEDIKSAMRERANGFKASKSIVKQ